MNRVFADTSYYIALMGERDQHHAAAVAHALAFYGEIITTDFVLVEVGNAARTPANRIVFTELARSLREDSETVVVPASRTLLDKGLALFSRRCDKTWSLTDCISFTAMREHGLTDAITGDRHFEQAGFRALLK